MKTKIDINYPAVGRVSLILGLLSFLVIFCAWDTEHTNLILCSAIILLFSGIGMMAWGCWKIDKMERERDERERTLPRRSW